MRSNPRKENLRAHSKTPLLLRTTLQHEHCLFTAAAKHLQPPTVLKLGILLKHLLQDRKVPIEVLLRFVAT